MGEILAGLIISAGYQTKLYCALQVQEHGVSEVADVHTFWLNRPPLGNLVMPYLWWPLSASVIERSFSLVGASVFDDR